MDETRVRCFNELHDALCPYRDDNKWVFRGQRDDPTWKLRPKAGRGGLKILDVDFFRAWKRNAAAFEDRPYQSEWDWLALAQHHGLATRLLDWTMNPLAAAYFAVTSADGNDGVIFAYFDDKALDAGLAREPTRFGRIGASQPPPEPFDITGVKKVRPRNITRRLVMQSGIFTIHHPPEACLEDAITGDRRLVRIIIDRSYLGNLKKDLSFYGVNEATLFPEIDGLSRHLNWYYQR